MAGNSQPRSRGRPKKVYKSRGRHAAAQRLSLFTSEEKSLEPSDNLDILLPNPEPPTLEIPPLTEEEKLFAQLSLDRPSVQHVLKISDGRPSLPLFLGTVRRLGPTWKKVGSLPTTDIPLWFDAQVYFFFPSIFKHSSNSFLDPYLPSSMTLTFTSSTELKL